MKACQGRKGQSLYRPAAGRDLAIPCPDQVGKTFLSEMETPARRGKCKGAICDRS